MNISHYHEARILKNRHYDGHFFFAVKTTGIFCRPSCPSPIAKEENVVYYPTIFDALDHGYRPCLRCRPDIHTDYYSVGIDGGELVVQGLTMIYEGFLNNHSIPELSAALYVSPRYLRQLFMTHLGLPPIKVAKYHQCLFAKKLLLTTDLFITDIAYASGYRSIRQFNDAFKTLFKASPRAIRQQVSPAINQGIIIPYDDTFDFDSTIEFMGQRALTGVEQITKTTYTRTFRRGQHSGYFTVTNQPELQALSLVINTDDVRSYMPIYQQVRRMFDLNTDFAPINAALIKDPLLKEGMTNGMVPRIPLAFNPFEFVIRAILGQVVSVSFATTLAQRLVTRCDIQTPADFPDGLNYFFPTPEELGPIDLTELGMTRTKIATISHVIEALLTHRLDLDYRQSYDNFRNSFLPIKGIGDWTVNYVAMRALGMRDAFPYSDLAIIKAFSSIDHKASHAQIKAAAESWRPYRAYGTMCLWNRH